MMFKVYLGYAGMWFAILVGLLFAILAGQFWGDGRAGYMLLMFGLAWGFLYVAAVCQSYAATRKMIIDDEQKPEDY